MKTKKSPTRFKSMLTTLGVAATLFAHFPAFASGDDPIEDKPGKKSKFKLKSLSAMNNSSVRIYPDIIKRDMHVVAKSNIGGEIDFFVFDVEGTMLQHYKMKEKDHYVVSGLERGRYTYRVFKGDEETATGDFQIR
jgi:hypothetical protein